LRQPPSPPLFPYTTLFRSHLRREPTEAAKRPPPPGLVGLAAPPAAPSRSPHREPVRSHALAAISVKAEPPRRVVRDRVGKGCLSFERFCQAAWAFAILLYRLFSRVEKILLISFGPGHSARANLEKLET